MLKAIVTKIDLNQELQAQQFGGISKRQGTIHVEGQVVSDDPAKWPPLDRIRLGGAGIKTPCYLTGKEIVLTTEEGLLLLELVMRIEARLEKELA